MSAIDERQAPNGSRLVGWKAIAAHLGVSQRTAVRWADTYHLPVSRVPRGDRPIVFSTVNELDDWWRSPAAAPIRGEARPAQEIVEDLADDAIEATCPENPDTGAAASHAPLWRRRWFRTLALGLGFLLTVLAGCYATGFRWSPARDRTLAWRTRDGAHGEALSPLRVRLILKVGGKTTSVVVAEGEMARLETPAIRVGLQSRVTKDALKVFVFRLGRAGSRESATFLGSRNLATGGVDHVPLDGLSVQLSWELVDSPAYAAREPPKEPCCMVCAGVAVCGEVVAGECGRCEADTGPRH